MAAARFSEAAAQLAGVAGLLLGWRPDEFWRATPAELAAVLGAASPAAGSCPAPADIERLKEMFPDG